LGNPGKECGDLGIWSSKPERGPYSERDGRKGTTESQELAELERVKYRAKQQCEFENSCAKAQLPPDQIRDSTCFQEGGTRHSAQVSPMSPRSIDGLRDSLFEVASSLQTRISVPRVVGPLVTGCVAIGFAGCGSVESGHRETLAKLYEFRRRRMKREKREKRKEQTGKKVKSKTGEEGKEHNRNNGKQREQGVDKTNIPNKKRASVGAWRRACLHCHYV